MYYYLHRLAHLCTDQQNNSAGMDQPCVGFNAEQLEECDLEGKDNFLQRINLFTRATTHLARLGCNNHVLFTYKRKHGQMVCLRYDHDACVWEMGNGDNDIQWNLQHVHSFPGFGYVEASKTNKKFCVSPIGKATKIFFKKIFQINSSDLIIIIINNNY